MLYRGEGNVNPFANSQCISLYENPSLIVDVLSGLKDDINQGTMTLSESLYEFNVETE
jgi:hypothetical protein